MQKSAIRTIAALLLLTACNEVVMDPGHMGSISLSLSSDVEVEAPTKAGSVDCSNFKVNIDGQRETGEEYHEDYVYGTMNNSVAIYFGTYDVSAESCSEATAIDGLGCVRYYGITPDVQIASQTAVPVTVNCKMVNAKASLTLDQSFRDDFTGITATLAVSYTENEAVVTREVSVPFTEAEPAGGQEIYFNVPESGASLVYTVTATILEGTEQEHQLTYSNASQPMNLLPAKWAKIVIKSNHNGTIGGPDISVDDELGESSSTEIIDPDTDADIDGTMNLPKIIVNTTLADATVVDCVLDVK